jgi:hypothetical protein
MFDRAFDEQAFDVTELSFGNGDVPIFAELGAVGAARSSPCAG